MVCLVFHCREYFGDRQRGFVQGDNLILLVRGLVIGDGVGRWFVDGENKIYHIHNSGMPRHTLSRLVSGYLRTYLG